MRLFVDTGAWFALRKSDDQHHVRASRFFGEIQGGALLLYTTDYIVDEAATMLRVKLSHRDAVDFLAMTTTSPQLMRGHVGPDLIARAEAIFRSHPDKRWPYTDCVSFAYMDEMGLEDAFTFDRNFAQYGKRVHPA
jgi:predicted nucleic acid-binding protein